MTLTYTIIVYHILYHMVYHIVYDIMVYTTIYHTDILVYHIIYPTQPGISHGISQSNFDLLKPVCMCNCTLQL
jgi:hypothetical protein